MSLPARPPMLVGCFLAFAALCPTLCHATRQPAKRDHAANDYYVVEVDPAVSIHKVAEALGVAFVEQAGELANHWLLSLPKEKFPSQETRTPNSPKMVNIRSRDS